MLQWGEAGRQEDGTLNWAAWLQSEMSPSQESGFLCQRLQLRSFWDNAADIIPNQQHWGRTRRGLSMQSAASAINVLVSQGSWCHHTPHGDGTFISVSYKIIRRQACLCVACAPSEWYNDDLISRLALFQAQRMSELGQQMVANRPAARLLAARVFETRSTAKQLKLFSAV